MDNNVIITDNRHMRLTKDGFTVTPCTHDNVCDICQTRPATIDVHEIVVVCICETCNTEIENDDTNRKA